MPKIANIYFNANFFNSYMKNIFGESLAYSSLSCEKIFEESKKYSKDLETFISPENTRYACLLNNGTEEDKNLLNQKLNEIKQFFLFRGIPEHPLYTEDDENEFETISIEKLEDYLIGAVRPYRSPQEIATAKANGTYIEADYSEETVFERCMLLLNIMCQKISKDAEAKLLKKGNNEAFQYALQNGPISIDEIMEINYRVNNGAGIKKGFKTSDNQITGANFKTCPKELVPIRMQELLYKYHNEWKKEIPEFDHEKSTTEEKERYLKAVCEREAKFHIEFERIHPFEDGNGRSGRIILNKNLIQNELAPVFITREIRSTYVKYINDCDYVELGNLIYMLYSISLTNMISAYRRAQGVNPNELALRKYNFKTNKNKLIHKN